MTIEEIAAIVNPWFATGSLTAENRELLKEEYAKQFGYPGECTSCYWNDVQTHFRLLIRSHTMNNNTEYKYIVKPGIVIRRHGSAQTIVSENADGKNRIQLTDELAEELYAESAGYRDQIIDNPNYVPKATGPATTKPVATTTAPTTPKTTVRTTNRNKPAEVAPPVAPAPVIPVPAPAITPDIDAATAPPPAPVVMPDTTAPVTTIPPTAEEV